ncbi:MAG: CHAP domain-containing protein [Pirellula sp.]
MRKIEQKMVEFLDERLAKHGAAQEAILEKDARNLFIYAAEVCVGIREKSGNNDGPMVELLQETIGSASNEAWCLSFVQTCLAYVEFKTGIKSPIFASEHCLTTWEKTDKKQRVKIRPLPGAIIIWQHGKSSNGHTGVLTEWNVSEFLAIEGNTTSGLRPDGSIERDGGGVYATKRNSKANGEMKVVGFLKPF